MGAIAPDFATCYHFQATTHPAVWAESFGDCGHVIHIECKVNLIKFVRDPLPLTV